MNRLEFWATDHLSDTSQASTYSCAWEQDLNKDPAFSFQRAASLARVTSQGSQVFDLASMTKVLCTGALLVKWAQEDKLSLEELGQKRLSDFVPDFKNTILKNTNIAELWEHRSAFVANVDLSDRRGIFYKLSQRADLHVLLCEVLKRPSSFDSALLLKNETCYSDIGFMALCLILEKASGQNLNIQWKALKAFLHIENQKLDFAIDNVACSAALATENRHPAGQVNDDKAYVMGGVATHAGLFGDVEAVKAWLQSVLLWSQNSRQAHEWLYTDRSGLSSRFYWGWDTPSGALDSHAGASAPKGVRGHLGYTGTAFWLHPHTQRAAILLSNRVYPMHSVESRKSIQLVRSGFFDSFWQGTLKESWKI